MVAMKVSLKEGLLEVRWHGRGGQGVVTASNLLASAALREGLFFRSLPEFGAERSGAPITASTRIGQTPIHEQGQIATPDVVIVLDPSLAGRVDFLSGLKEGGTLMINTALSPGEVRDALGLRSGQVCTVDATAIAMRHLRRNIPNVVTLGALLKAVEVVSRESAIAAIESDLAGRFRPEIVKANLDAFDQGYQEARLG